MLSTWIYDVRVTGEQILGLPDLPEGALTLLLYVFGGRASVGDFTLGKGESLVIKNEPDVKIESAGADLVLFATDEQSRYYAGGMFSGNQY